MISFEDVYKQNTPTIDWLEKVQKMYPDQKIVWYTGSDSIVPKPEYDNLSEIEAKWDRGDELVRDWNFLIFPRHGYQDLNTLNLSSNFEIADIHLPDISSTEVRKRILADEDFGELLMPKATEYIKQNGLYGYNKGQ